MNMNSGGTPTYHDLFITTADIPRTSIFNLGYSLVVMCTHISGWELWKSATRQEDWKLLAGEFDGNWLVLDVEYGTPCTRHVIVDSRPGADSRKADDGE